MINNNPFETLNIPELHKNKIVCIDKDKIPQEKAQWTKEDSVKASRSLLKGLTTPCLIKEGDNKDYAEWVNKLTDDEAIEIASKIANAILATIEMKKETLALIPEVTLEQLDKMVKGEKDNPPEIAVSFGISGDIALEKDNNENYIIKSIKPKSFNLDSNFIAQPLNPIIKERLSEELGIGEIPDDLETQVHLCRTWLKSKDFFALPVEGMYDWQVILLTSSALSCPDDTDETYHNLITSKDVEEATEAYETTSDNFNTVFNKPE